MLPLIMRATEEMLRLVPRDMREARLALGVTQARTIVSVVLPTASAGIITGVMLAVARAMGETAPLLLTTLGNDLFIELNPGKRMSTLVAADLRQRDRRIPGRASARLGRRAHIGGDGAAVHVAARLIARRSSVVADNDRIRMQAQDRILKWMI